MPEAFFEDQKAYVFFSHTIKGQKQNMPMLGRLLHLGCHLIDYEKIVDETGKRLLFFGRFAGLAGMIDSLWALGQRLLTEGVKSPFEHIEQAYRYSSLTEAEEAVRAVGERIREDGLPASTRPLIVGFTGYGHVSSGAQEIFDILPHRSLAPGELSGISASTDGADNRIFKAVFREEHMVKPSSSGYGFNLQDYYDHPEKYTSCFEQYLPNLTVMINAVYWAPQYPRLVTKQGLNRLFDTHKKPRLRLIVDISCDIEGSVECTERATQPDNPVYVYSPLDQHTQDGFDGRGVVILPIDNFPCELPRESSDYFGNTLEPFIPELADTDFSKSLDSLGLSNPLLKGLIVHKGELTPDYTYLTQYL